MENDKESEPLIGLNSLLEILGNPTRRVILSKLAKVPHSTSELASSLSITRQAVHSQLEILSRYNIIEKIGSEKRGGKYRIKSNLSLRINISPNHYNIRYNVAKVEKQYENIQINDIASIYNKIKVPDQKLKFLGVRIKEIQKKIKELERERSELLQDKECFIVELKNVMNLQFDSRLRREQPNLEKEIFFTLFFNPERYHRRINIDFLLDDLFFANMDLIQRDQNRVSIQHLLRDLSKFMDFISEKEDDWFFDI